MTIELSGHYSSYEKGKCYIAEIRGTDRKFRFNREFLATRKSESRSGATGNKMAHVGDGLYEVASTGRHGTDSVFYLVRENAAPEEMKLRLSADAAERLAKLLDTGARVARLRLVDGKLPRDDTGKLTFESEQG